jgi:23S rRNA (uracil1939-C5)-methyltransferase
MIEIVEASPDRVTPRCPYFGVCGGCSLQHLRAEAQLPAKQKILYDNLTRIGKVEPESWLGTGRTALGIPAGAPRRALVQRRVG